jgi:predicted AlkP superfamily phosphohydrolase/phosphomutase
VAGVEARGALLQTLLSETPAALTIAVFNEVHHASHYLWHAFEPEHALYRGIPRTPDPTTAAGLTTLYAAVDRQIGALVNHPSAAGSAVIVFSLHGMRAATGVAAFLGPWLVDRGFARLAGWRQKSWRERLIGGFAALKRHSPQALKSLYYRTVPAETTRQLAQPTMLPAYDWTNTRAFALPTDQHGWIRVNLGGRESRGIVPPADYAAVVDELDAGVRALCDEQGRPLVERTIRTSASADEARRSGLPDLVVHWTDAALAWPVRIRGSRVETSAAGRKFTSQHALDGFCVSRGFALPPGEAIADADLHRIITSPLGV